MISASKGVRSDCAEGLFASDLEHLPLNPAFRDLEPSSAWVLWFLDIVDIQKSGKMLFRQTEVMYVSCSPTQRFSTKKENRPPNLNRSATPNRG